jgi:hypothetical protein
MQANDLDPLKKYIPAQGPEGLRHVLEDLMQKSKQDRAFAIKEHFIMYQLGDQKSLIKIDLSQDPVLFWYLDLLGRPAPRNVKKVIFDFLWDKCGVREKYIQEYDLRK